MQRQQKGKDGGEGGRGRMGRGGGREREDRGAIDVSNFNNGVDLN